MQCFPKKGALIELDEHLKPKPVATLFWYIPIDAYVYQPRMTSHKTFVVLGKCFYQKKTSSGTSGLIYVSRCLLTMCSNPNVDVVILEWDFIARQNEGVSFLELSRFMKLVVDEEYEHVLNHDNGICEAEARVDAVMLQQRRYYDPSRGIKVSEKEDIWKLSDSQLEATGYRMAENSAMEKDFLAWVGSDAHLNGDKTNFDLNRCSSRILSKRVVDEAQKQVFEIKEEKKKTAELHQKLQTEKSSKKSLEKSWPKLPSNWITPKRKRKILKSA
jgi:hypothetical protein